MGYQSDKGLGAKQQGRLDPVQTELRLGRAGLGAKKTGLEPNPQETWDDSRERVFIIIIYFILLIYIFFLFVILFYFILFEYFIIFM